MADSEWRLEEDGQLKLDVKCNSLIYHPNLNIIIVLTKSSEVLVVDVNSGLLLQRSHLSASDSAIQGQYLPGYDKILLANEKGIGVRSDYNGVLLLDTILQTPISKPDEIVKLEIPLSEAQILKQTLQCMDLQGVERVSEVVEELTNKTKEADAKSKKGLKAQKWNTVCLSVGHCALKWVCAGMVSELRRQNRHIPALSTASALSERLNWLLLPPAAPSGAASAAAASDTPPPDRTLMFSEAIRRQTFANWPHMNYKWALPDQMAQAGFYHQPNSAGDDRAMCFTCIVCLVCWEPTDEPWSEHERHSPSCPFVKGEYTQNVPLSVTYATAPAVATPHPVTILGTSSVPELFATATVTGLIQVWNCSRQLKNEISFYSFGSDARTYPREGWAEQEIVEIPLSDFTLDNLIKNSSSQDIKLGAVSIVGMLKHPSPSASASGGVGHQDATDDEDDATSRYRRPALITGISVMSRSKRPPQSSGSVVVPPSVRAMNDVNQATGGATSSATSDHLDIMKVMDGGSSSGNYDRQLLLVVYDFHYQSSSGRALPKEGSWSGGGGGGGGGGGPGGGGLGGSGTNGINNVTVDGNVGGVGGGGGGSYSSAVANQSKGGGGASKKVGSGTGTSASRLENNIQEIFLSKLFYCQNSLMDDVELAPEPEVHYSSMPSFQATEAFPSQPPPIAVVVPPVGGGTFNASMGMDMMQFPSTSSNMAPPSVIKVSVSNRELKAAGSGGGVGGGRSYNGGGSVCVSASAREPASVQCVTVDTSGRNSAITGIYPTRDGRHVLVTLGSTSDEERTSSGGVFVIYALVFDRPVVSVRENPLCWREFESEPKQVLLLPLGSDSTSLAASPLGVAVIVTDDGALHVIDVATLETLSTMSPPDGTKFVTATYCFSLERLCASTADGDLHFFSMKDGDDRKQDEASSLSMDQSSSLQKPNGEQMLVTSPVLSIRELRLLFELTQFENLSPCYAATVPACWTELMQAQKQRRHPQHLQHADELHHTRSWRLQHDNSTWDEHVFEITLPMSVCIGHVDVKFTLHSHCATPPQIEVTLLKQNATAIGKTQDNFNRNTIVDSGIDFNLNTDGAAGKKGSQENPVTNEDYLQTHNMEVLCGPINLASCLDLTEQGGTVTFSSVKLFRVRSRTLLVHMKSLADPASGQASGKKAKVDPNFSWDMANMANSTPDSIVERLTNASRKVEYVGCDWIHEVSITIRKAKQTEIPNDRLERYAMLESNKFVEKLLDAIFSNEGNGDRGRVEQNIALDILNWIAVIRLGRLRCCQPSWLRLQIEFIKMIQSYQHILIQTCFVQGGRSIAQKCVKLFTICSDGVKNLEDNSLKDFNRSLVEVFLESLNYSILQSWSAGAMRWFFHCLARMIASDPNSALKASYRSLMLLSKVARHLKMRQNPSYLLLRSRFGLYGTPFEAELFDIDPPVPAKFSSMPVTYASLVAQELAWAGGVGSIPSSALGGLSSEPIDLRELLPIFGNGNNQTESGKPNLYHNLAKLKGLTSNLYMKGLLEVEPLHFTCHSTSDGTKLEKMESAGINNPWGNLYEAQPFHLATSESKSTNDYDGVFSWQQLLMAPAQQMLVIERMHSGARRFVVLDLGAPVLLTDLIVPACPELLSLSVDIWTRSEEADAQRLVVASDIASKTLVMSDIQPPPICRYIKITTIGRYGMSTTKCKIPIGSFFGHMVLLPGEDYAEKNSQIQNMSEENAQNQIQVLSALFEDVQCRYSLACSKLENLVTPLLSSESPNVGHMYNYLHKIKETSNNLETQKITTAYQECITYQHQLNIIRSVMRRFGAKSAPVSTDIQQNLTTACTDKLRVLGESLTDLLLYIVYGVGFDPRVDSAHLHQMVDESQCERLFNCICVGEDIRMQVSCCTLLVRLCGLQPWWGSFLVNTIKQLYSSKQFNIFPQDRVFILLIYMGRKSLCGGANRSSVMDSLLKTILNQLESLATAPAAAGSDGAVAGEDSSAGAAAAGSAAAAASTGFFRLQMDLSLVGWLLLFLSQCLDSQPSFCSLDELPDKMKNSKNCAPASRWDFLQGEMAMQRRTYLTNKCTASRNYRRKLQKKLMHHKQQLDDLETAKKAFHASTQALSALSSQAAKLSCKLESALKQQEQYYKKSSKQATSPRSKDQPGSFRSSRSGECSGDIDGKRASSSLKDSDCQFLMLPRTHCLPVARALIKFLLHMDITCNIDLFLLVCKVIARVTVWTKPAVSLGEIMTQDQLASLLLIAVSNRSVWGGPWASHAITCLLQDIIQGVNSKPSSPVDQSDSRADSKEPDDPLPSLIDVNSIPGPSSSSAKNGESYVLPSLFESDDSEMEDLLEDILERGKSLFIRKSSSRMAVGAVSSISTAVDSRLEYGLENNVSVNLRRITAQAAYNLPLCINSSIAQKALQNDGSTLPVWDESITAPWQLPVNSSVGLSSIEMLSTAFDTLFGQLNQSRDGDLEAVVQLWLTLSTENDSSGGGRNFDASVVPLIQLSPAAISSLMSTLANRGGISVREWCLSFQALTLFSNLQRNCPCQDGGSGSSATTATTAATDHDHLAHTLCGAASLVVMDTNFVPMLDAFLSSPHIKGCAGVSVCNSLHELLVRLEMRCDVVSGNSTWGNRLKELLLNLVYMLVSEGGAIAALYGPLDAQTGLILLLLHLSFPKINLSTAVGILQSVGVLIERYVLNSEGIKGRGVAEPSHVTQPVPAGGSSLTFVLNNPSWEHLLIVMIRLITNLVQTPLESPDHTLLEPTSQTDEHKAANGPSQVVKAKCVADFVVQQELTMAQLIGGLGGCVRSTFSMFQGPFSPDSTDSGDPVSIGDALLQLLSTLAAKATDPKLILKPLFTHLSTCGLTEPLQWLVLQVLDSDHALRELLEMSGIETISTNLVETSGMLISSHPSTVSVIMQYLSQMPNCAPLTSSAHHKKGGCSSSSQTATSNNNYANNSAAANSNNNHNGSSNGHGSAAGSSGGNGSAGVQLESHDAMVNFAPLGSIICSSNPSSQSADVLIQPAPPHRRARTPAWSYHFYTEESWVELTITLPCAVLLKAVHIQPHLSSLATCPSGVSVEISRDGRGSFVPVAAPFNTSGLTFVRLTLPHPEVVTSVLLRLYKPRDSSNIGLSQIKLLGATTFGDSDLPEARRPGRYTQSSLGWLRLLHHCLTSASDPTLKEAMLDAAATGAGERLLSACCSLLLASSPPSVTESVLLTLGLHSSQLGLQLINVLLTNGGSLSTAVQSVVGLLFKLGTTDDAYTKDRLATMLEWLHQAATTAQNQLSTAYIQCLASILWTCYEKNINCDMPSMITQPLFSSVYEWTLKLSPHSCLKKAIDSVLCSMCYINPALFPTLLQRMNILVPICTSSPQASISDDRKDTETSSQTDDSKEQESERDTEWYNRLVLQDQNNLSLSEGQLMTVATACQSPPATRHLLDSGLPNLITQALLGFCVKKKHSESKKEQANQSRMTDSDKASERNHVFSVNAMGVMLKFLEEVCMAGQMRDWLGSAEGSIFWGPLLSLLCNKTSTEKRCEVSSTLHSLESATVSFLARCCWCHPNNQKLLAKVLSDVISQHKTTNHKTGGISGVTRRMILQLLLESEKVYVSVQGMQNSGVVTPTHPRHVSRLLHLSVHTTIADILKMISGANGLNENAGADGNETKDVRRDSPKNWHEMTEQQWCEMSVAAGVTAKDKRLKDAKNAVVRGPYGKKPRTNLPDTQTSLNNRLCLRHPDLEERSLPGSLTLSQLLYILDERGISLSNPYVFLTLEQANGTSISNEGEPDLTLSPSLPTALQVFTQQGGLALLAQHLPPVYPETLVHFGLPEKTVTATDSAPADQVVYDAWVKVEHNDDIYEDLDEYVCLGEGGQSSSTVGGGGSSKRQTECGGSGVSAPSVPLHSLAAFGLFLRLPGYAEVLLRDKCKAQCLLRLTLGVTDDGEGGDILTCAVASSLPTLPFEVLRILLESTPLTTDDGVLLRRTTLETGALHLLLSCLAVFTHFPQDLPPLNNQQVLVTSVSKANSCNDKPRKAEEKSHLYWAKGTGFGTGSTAQSWNVEQALSRQRTEEEHVTVLLQVLSSYINPGGRSETYGSMPKSFNLDMETSSEESTDVEDEPERTATPPLPSVFHDILQQSCLLPALSSYLRNDSVLDMARHIPLYRAVLQLLRAMALNPQLVSLLLPQKATIASNELSIVCLLVKMQNCVDIYANRLKNNKTKGHRKSIRSNNNNNNTNNNNNNSKTQEEIDSDEGLALLIPDIQQTACLVQVLTTRIVYDSETDGESTSHAEVEKPLQRTLEERYLEVMKALQFDTYEMIVENSDSNGFQFVVSYHFESNVRSCGERSHPTRMKRLAQETVTLSTSLPLSYSSSVFVRCDSDRLDIMKVLITGPAETPYANGCFELDVFFPPDYPNSPMLINLETTGHHTIRFNPNLYNDGKVCLSVLNTWQGRPEEKWNAHTSSFLQVLVSIQSLILVPEPYFNEPGYERSRGTPSGDQSSREYNSNICQATVKWAMLEQLRNPSPCFKQIIQTHFWMKQKEIRSQIENWIVDMESQASDRRTGRAISLNAIALKRHYHQLLEELRQLRPPPGMEDLAEVEVLSAASDNYTLSSPTNAPAPASITTPTSSTAPSTTAMMVFSSTPPKSTTTPTNSAPETPQANDLETDLQMEKMVSQVCE